jgi:hypothetical protein
MFVREGSGVHCVYNKPFMRQVPTVSTCDENNVPMLSRAAIGSRPNLSAMGLIRSGRNVLHERENVRTRFSFQILQARVS